MKYILLGIAGAIGSSLRYFVSIIFLTSHAPSFPFATLTVNLLGCFILALLSSGLELYIKINSNYLLAIKSGLIGSFTTFSTFSVEVFLMLESQLFLSALIYILLSSILGFLLALLGVKIGEKLVKKGRLL